MPNLLISKTDALGADRTALLASVKQGDVLLVTDPGGEVVQVKVTGTPVAASTHYAYPYDSFTAGTEPTDEEPVDLSVVISGPAGPEGGADSTHPAAPTWPASPFATVFSNGPGGDPEIGLQVTVVHPTLNEDATPIDDLAYTRVQVTLADPASPDPENPVPDWDHPTIITVPADQTSVVLMGIRGGRKYWARARAFDKSNNGSAWTTPDLTYITRTDDVAPGMPQSVELTGGFKGFGARWQGSDARDLMFYELRYFKDLAGVPDSTTEVRIRARSNAIYVGGLELDLDGSGAPEATPYWVQVRAIDFSGNVVLDASDDAPSVPYDTNFDAGFTDALAVDALPVGTEDIAANAITANMIATIELDAGVITTGFIKVSTSDGYADGIEMFSGGTRIGKWDETGLYIGKLPDGLPFIETDDGHHIDQLDGMDYMVLTDAGLTVYRAGVAVTAVTPDGIDASAINFGTLPGGHNIAKNTSFELSGFVAASSTFVFDTIAQFQAQDVAGHTNVGTVYTGDKVAMTSTAY